MAAPTDNVENDALCIIEATVATGFEQTAREEVIEKLGVDVRSARGKIIITTPIALVPKILKLGTIDNCRVVVKHIRGFEFPKDQAESLQKVRGLVKDIDWAHGIKVWQQVFNFDHPINVAHEDASGNVGSSETKDKETLLKKQPKDKKSKKKGRGKKKNEKEKGPAGQTGKEKEKIEKKPAKDKGEKSKTSQVAVDGKDEECKTEDDLPASPHEEDQIQTTDTSESEQQVEVQAEVQVEVQAEVQVEVQVEVQEEVQAEVQEPSPEETSAEQPTPKCSESTATESPTKECETPADVVDVSPKKKEGDPSKPKFRVTCNRTGDHHKFDSTNTASNFGGAIYSYFGWNVDLVNFDIEVILNIDWDDVSVCLSLTKESLHRRLLTSFGMTTLRPTIAYNMLRLCELKCGDVVCDPLCGSGSIPISASVSWPLAIHLCGEKFGKAVDKTWENLTNLNAKKTANKRRLLGLDIYQWDATKLPLRDGCVDVFVTDLPFGRRHSRGMPNNKLYPLVINEMARVTRKETGRACFITEDKKCMVKIIQESRVWQRRKVLAINMGGINTGVYLLHRTNEDVEQKSHVELDTRYRNKRPLSSTENNGEESNEDPISDTSKEAHDTEEDNSTASKNADSCCQTTEETPQTTDCSSQVSGTNISSSETSSQTQETGSPRKRVKIDIAESECQTTCKLEEIPTIDLGGHVEGYTETRSLTTETMPNITAETGSQIEVSSTTESGIQVGAGGESPVKIKTRSQSNGTLSDALDTRSQSTETRQTMADTGCQATPTRNTATHTSVLPVRSASTDTYFQHSASESGIQAIESTVKVDTGLQAIDTEGSHLSPTHQEEESLPDSTQHDNESEIKDGSKVGKDFPNSPVKNEPISSEQIKPVVIESQSLPDSTQLSPKSDVKVESTTSPKNKEPVSQLPKSPLSTTPSKATVTSEPLEDGKGECKRSQHSKVEEASTASFPSDDTTKEKSDVKVNPVPTVADVDQENVKADSAGDPSVPENVEKNPLTNLKSDKKHGSSVDLVPASEDSEATADPSKVLGEKNEVKSDEGKEKKNGKDGEGKEKDKGCLII